MSSFTQLTCHFVFATKHRLPTIRDCFRERMHAYMGGIIRARKGQLLAAGGLPDHLHLLACCSPTIAIADLIRDIKANSSKWINELPGGGPPFEWQKGYGAFSVSWSNVGRVEEYIRNQAEHHRIKSFQDEYIGLLKRHKIPFAIERLFEEEHVG
jgi:putative transposase